MKGVLYNSKDKKVIMIVQETNKHYAAGFNMRTETYTQVRLVELEKTDLKTIFNYTGKEVQLIALIAEYFKRQKGITSSAIAGYAKMSERTLHRYIANTKVNELV
jgi:hypothetical protein